jgi:phosphoserine phosphatase
MNIEERKRMAKLNAEWLAGEKIDALQFRYNTTVIATLSDGTILTGWIVGASVDGPEPVYTIEAQDGSGDIECAESTILEVS